MLVTVAVITAAALGFVAGLCAYRSSRRWCGACGDVLTCPTCATIDRRRRNAGPARP